MAAVHRHSLVLSTLTVTTTTVDDGGDGARDGVAHSVKRGSAVRDGELYCSEKLFNC